MLDGDGSMSWVDPPLTEQGRAAAIAASKFISHQINVEKMPIPKTIYTSPQNRALETTDLVYSDLKCFKDAPFRPIVTDVRIPSQFPSSTTNTPSSCVPPTEYTTAIPAPQNLSSPQNTHPSPSPANSQKMTSFGIQRFEKMRKIRMSG
jgi:bisphosphoglycerate-dependent phosphoglycerate mutase